MVVKKIICNEDNLLENYEVYNDLDICVPVVGDIISIGRYSENIRKNNDKYAEESKLYIATKRMFEVVKGYNGKTKTDVYLYVDVIN